MNESSLKVVLIQEDATIICVSKRSFMWVNESRVRESVVSHAFFWLWQMLFSPQIQIAILRTLGIKTQPGLQATVLSVHRTWTNHPLRSLQSITRTGAFRKILWTRSSNTFPLCLPYTVWCTALPKSPKQLSRRPSLQTAKRWGCSWPRLLLSHRWESLRIHLRVEWAQGLLANPRNALSWWLPLCQSHPLSFRTLSSLAALLCIWQYTDWKCPLRRDRQKVAQLMDRSSRQET